MLEELNYLKQFGKVRLASNSTSDKYSATIGIIKEGVIISITRKGYSFEDALKYLTQSVKNQIGFIEKL